MDDKRTQSSFRLSVNECLEKAQSLYGVDFGRVTVTFDLKGSSCGEAVMRPHPRLGRTFALRFNKEALEKDWDMMVESTIPHEVAHLVAYADPKLGASKHNRAWKMIAIKLGDRDKGNVYHKLKLTPARKTRRYSYNVSGENLQLTAKQHRDIQSGALYVSAKTKALIEKNHFIGIA